MLFGEGTPQSCMYRVYIDGKPVEHYSGSRSINEFDAAKIARAANGNAHFVEILADNLDAHIDHILEIEPLFDNDKEQELRIESLCVAGGNDVRFADE
jgi:hypothetical protein